MTNLLLRRLCKPVIILCGGTTADASILLTPSAPIGNVGVPTAMHGTAPVVAPRV